MAALICETCKNKGKRCYCAPNSTCSDYDEVNTKHTVFDKFRSMNIDELAEWLDKYIQFDASPWCQWFDTNYCKNCEPIMCNYPDSEFQFPCAWCELENKCKFFPEMDGVPSIKDIVKMWLESEE